MFVNHKRSSLHLLRGRFFSLVQGNEKMKKLENLNNWKNLEKLEKLEKLKNLEKLEKLEKLKKLSYNFYKNSKITNENNYEDVININKKINILYKNEKVYNNQSYILILKGFMNILYQTKEENKRNIIKNVMNSFVLYFKDYIYYMNEQDITLLLDIKGKCGIKNISLHKLIIDKLIKKKKENTECLFYKLNTTSVSIILNNLYKINISTKEKELINDIYDYYILNKYSNYNIKQLIILLHSLNKYSYPKEKIIHLLNYISTHIYNYYQIKNQNKYSNSRHILSSHIEHSYLLNNKDDNNEQTNNKTHNIIKTAPSIPCPNYMNYKLHSTRISSKNNNISCSDNKRENFFLQNKTINKKNNTDILFDKKDKYEVILFYTMSCYNYCNNNIIKILLEEMKNKIIYTYNEKEICMFLNGVCNYIAVKNIKKFEKHCINEDESINSINKEISLYYIHNIILKNNNTLIKNYSTFSIISVYIFLSRLNYFYYYGRNKELWFLNKLFYNYNQYDDIIRKINDKKNIYTFFSYHIAKKKENITIKNIINLLFSLILNGHMNHFFYNILLQQMNFLIYDHLYNINEEDQNFNYISHKHKYIKQSYYNNIIHKEYYKDDNIFKNIIQILSFENIQILSIVYTYLYIYNILYKLNKNNLSLFLLFIQNSNYLNSFYLSQHTSSKTHKEINDTIFSVNTKIFNQKYNSIQTNECFIFPYYIDICLMKIN
ncbi:hypothetical protein PGSY75_0511900 [Plasmodium gaboni]|uniref:Uncharacterized protein n=1 Tax=Plasmodium gaboni TaxID=647221 RepID=A0A151LT07_9APIC|nr:hypothetical protein PGSY75_0511900 [Plasmodium gaboni]KYO02314.1 hypothetical protein PGSY75_0511900 [Plasmodium gaboni]